MASCACSGCVGCGDDALQDTTELRLAHRSGAHGRPQPAFRDGDGPPPGSFSCFFHLDEDTGLKDCPPHLGLWSLHAMLDLQPCDPTGLSCKTLLALPKGCLHPRSQRRGYAAADPPKPQGKPFLGGPELNTASPRLQTHRWPVESPRGDNRAGE